MLNQDTIIDEELDLITQNASYFDILELRLDQLSNIEVSNIETLLNNVKSTVQNEILLTYRTASQGGFGELSNEAYLQLNQQLAQLTQVDMIDVEWEAYNETRADLVQYIKDQNKEVIASYHDFNQTPTLDVLKKTYFNMSKLGAHHLKVAVTPQRKKDVLTLLEAVSEASDALSQWITGISMTQLGVISRTAQEVFGGALTYGALAKEVAPGQLNVRQLSQLLPVYSLVENTTIVNYN